MKKKTLSYTENGKQTTVLLFKNINNIAQDEDFSKGSSAENTIEGAIGIRCHAQSSREQRKSLQATLKLHLSIKKGLPPFPRPSSLLHSLCSPIFLALSPCSSPNSTTAEPGSRPFYFMFELQEDKLIGHVGDHRVYITEHLVRPCSRVCCYFFRS